MLIKEAFIMFINVSERGQALIIIAVAVIGLFSLAALAIDGSRVFSNRRHAQNAADTAVLAAALAKIRGQDYVQAAESRAASNGYSNDDENTTVTVRLCSEEGVSCEGLREDANKDEYIQVEITSILPSTFAKILGRESFTNTVSAVARVHGSASQTSGSLFGGAALVSTRGGNYNQCFLMNGGGYLYTHDSAIFVNCSGSQAVFLNGNSDLHMDSVGQIVGCYFNNGRANFDPLACGVNGGVSQNINASTFQNITTTQAPPTCSTPGTRNGNTFWPGSFSGITINSGATAVFNPGVYCISGNFNLNGNATLSGPTGKVQFVLQDQNITLNGGAAIEFNDLEIYGRNATFTLNGGAVFRANRLRFFSTGTGNMIVNGNAELTSGDAYFYLHRGNLVWNGNSILTLRAPMQGDPFGGLLVHKPWENNQRVTLNGGSDIHLTGTFLVPGSPVTFNGGVDFELHSQIIGYDYIVNGNADVHIYFIPGENYQVPIVSSPTIEFTK
jgi:hypothetical protein